MTYPIMCKEHKEYHNATCMTCNSWLTNWIPYFENWKAEYPNKPTIAPIFWPKQSSKVKDINIL